MLHAVVIDVHALAALDRLFVAIGKPLPRSAVVEHRNGLAWHAIPIDAATIRAIQDLRRSDDEPFNDTLRAMLDLPPVEQTCHGADAPGRMIVAPAASVKSQLACA